MSFNFAGLIAGLENGLRVVETLKPIATALGAPPGLVDKVTNIAGALIETGTHTMGLIEEGKVMATSGDQSQLKSVLERIQAENDELDVFIDANRTRATAYLYLVRHSRGRVLRTGLNPLRTRSKLRCLLRITWVLGYNPGLADARRCPRSYRNCAVVRARGYDSPA